MDKKNKNPNVPNLRFPLYKNKWECKKIKDILKICHGKDYKHLESGKYPVLGTSGIFTYVNQYLCDWPCALIGRKGASLDKPHYMNSPFWCVDTLYYSKPVKNNNPKWQYYFFQTINWMKMNESSGIPSLRASTIENIDVFVPSYQEQSNIVEFLDKIEQRIETQIKIIDSIKSQKQQIRNILFNDIHQTPNCCVQDYVAYEQPQKYIVHDSNYLPYSKVLIPVLTANQSFILGYTSENDGVYKKGDCIIFDDFTNESKYVNFPFKVNSYAFKILQTKEGLLLKFFYEYLQFLNFEAINHKRHYLSEVAITEINVPDLKKQSYVCKVLSSVDIKLKNEEIILKNYKLQKHFLLANLFV